jgi:hypothetical protein
MAASPGDPSMEWQPTLESETYAGHIPSNQDQALLPQTAGDFNNVGTAHRAGQLGPFLNCGQQLADHPYFSQPSNNTLITKQSDENLGNPAPNSFHRRHTHLPAMDPGANFLPIGSLLAQYQEENEHYRVQPSPFKPGYDPRTQALRHSVFANSPKANNISIGSAPSNKDQGGVWARLISQKKPQPPTPSRGTALRYTQAPFTKSLLSSTRNKNLNENFGVRNGSTLQEYDPLHDFPIHLVARNSNTRSHLRGSIPNFVGHRAGVADSGAFGRRATTQKKASLRRFPRPNSASQQEKTGIHVPISTADYALISLDRAIERGQTALTQSSGYSNAGRVGHQAFSQTRTFLSKSLGNSRGSTTALRAEQNRPLLALEIQRGENRVPLFPPDSIARYSAKKERALEAVVQKETRIAAATEEQSSNVALTITCPGAYPEPVKSTPIRKDHLISAPFATPFSGHIHSFQNIKSADSTTTQADAPSPTIPGPISSTYKSPNIESVETRPTPDNRSRTSERVRAAAAGYNTSNQAKVDQTADADDQSVVVAPSTTKRKRSWEEISTDPEDMVVDGPQREGRFNTVISIKKHTFRYVNEVSVRTINHIHDATKYTEHRIHKAVDVSRRYAQKCHDGVKRRFVELQVAVGEKPMPYWARNPLFRRYYTPATLHHAVATFTPSTPSRHAHRHSGVVRDQMLPATPDSPVSPLSSLGETPEKPEDETVETPITRQYSIETPLTSHKFYDRNDLAPPKSVLRRKGSPMKPKNNVTFREDPSLYTYSPLSNASEASQESSPASSTSESKSGSDDEVESPSPATHDNSLPMSATEDISDDQISTTSSAPSNEDDDDDSALGNSSNANEELSLSVAASLEPAETDSIHDNSTDSDDEMSPVTVSLKPIDNASPTPQSAVMGSIGDIEFVEGDKSALSSPTKDVASHSLLPSAYTPPTNVQLRDMLRAAIADQNEGTHSSDSPCAQRVARVYQKSDDSISEEHLPPQSHDTDQSQLAPRGTSDGIIKMEPETQHDPGVYSDGSRREGPVLQHVDDLKDSNIRNMSDYVKGERNQNIATEAVISGQVTGEQNAKGVTDKAVLARGEEKTNTEAPETLQTPATTRYALRYRTLRPTDSPPRSRKGKAVLTKEDAQILHTLEKETILLDANVNAESPVMDIGKIRLEEQAELAAAKKRIYLEQLKLQQEAEQRDREAERARQEAEQRAAEERQRLEAELERRSYRFKPEHKVVTPISDEWEAKIATAMAHRQPGKKLASYNTGSADVELTRRDFGTLLPQAGTSDRSSGWLNDEIVNGGVRQTIQFCLDKTNHKQGEQPKYHNFNSAFWTTVSNQGVRGVGRWAKKAKIEGAKLLQVDCLLIPINQGSSHWTLMVLMPSKKVVEYFDSFGGSGQKYLSIMREYLRQELGDKFVEEDWKFRHGISPLQTNGSDCGVFTITNARMVALGFDPEKSYNETDMSMQRKRIACELLSGGLIGDFEPKGYGAPGLVAATAN